MERRFGGHVINVSTLLAEVTCSGTPVVLAAMAKGGPSRGY